ncbi:MAG: ethanolamine utilization protein EutN [Candidatus Hydrogenedentota bacterium]|nr:MAG: ethanolamine utilization protein EutN [Candidatus Hydrogenedentota bacterium]
MYLARVVGRVWATRKNENYSGVPLFIVEKIDEDFRSLGSREVAIDSVGVGEGEVVWCEGGKEAAFALPSRYGPSDASIVAKVDHLDVALKPPADRPVEIVGERGIPIGEVRKGSEA